MLWMLTVQEGGSGDPQDEGVRDLRTDKGRE